MVARFHKWKSRTLKVRGGIISQANRYLGGFCSSQGIFPPQIIQLLLRVYRGSWQNCATMPDMLFLFLLPRRRSGSAKNRAIFPIDSLRGLTMVALLNAHR